ncbi:PBP1A family penicillin-binding protein [Sporosarcina sp. PTS2304]|uniref:transglycosylase domain-containing protein n=1 Tax=Sporosarcina sp. PTS2304 TaxID=2283194 RepID=UPI000E0DB2BE|nr:PBP1A family penicillin-binding protein [Sporosarcina sp. PTS2304]AXH98894.1 PBP1A family penicillin-binding protein [Sporosarcina sp. PTS2304]
MSDHINSRTARRQQKGTIQKKPNRKMPQGLFKKILMAIVLFGLAVLIGGASLFAYYASTAPDLDEELLKDPLTSNFLTKDGEVFLKFGTEKREFVPYDEIPEQMKNAILATEDIRFFKHGGVDFYRLGGAVLANFRSGFGSQGASTLTQQVIKNSFLKDEKTLKRKAQEAWLAHKLEKEYTKEEIFEMYFNKVLMSGNRYGFGTGASYFFGKKLNELELPEMAMLAGMPQYPNGYNPFKYPERAEKRRNIVLTLMNRHGKISTEEMEAAKKVPVTSTLLAEDERETFSKYPAYVDAVLDELEEAGYSDLLAEGVTVQTALDPKAQEAVEQAINDPSYYESEDMQAGMTVLDTKKGTIVALGGGRNYSGRNLNFAEQKRQPGSVIKPILAYGPAIEYLDWSTGQKVVDEPYKYKGMDKSINNADGRFLGTLTMRQALYYSRNVPAVKTFEKVGGKDAKAFASKLGLSYDEISAGNALGGGKAQFSTVEMAGAYAAFGNGGIYTKPHAVTKITLRDGKTVKNLRPDPVTAMKDSTAYMITDVLREVLTSYGTAEKAAISGMDVAGKTGTTNYSADTMREKNMKSHYVPDTWFTGYTTEYTISTWGGYADYKTPITTYDYGRHVPQNLFKAVMTSIASEPGEFVQPDSVEEAAIVKGSDPIVLASSFTSSSIVSNELFVRGTLPAKQAIPEKVSIPSPSKLSAQFDANSNSVVLNWNYKASKKYNSLGSPSFNVSVSIDGGAYQSITSTYDQQAVFSGTEYGKTYTFSVTATMGGYTSGSATATLSLAGSSSPEIDDPSVEEPDIDPEEPIEQPDQPDDTDDENDSGQNDSDNDGQDPSTNQGQDGQNNQDNQGNQNNQGNSGNSNNQGNQGQGNQGNQGQNQNTPSSDAPPEENN